MTTAAGAPTLEQLRAIPKAELHCHLDGSVRPATLLELGREYRVSMPAHTAAAMAEYMLVRDAHNLEEYLARFAVTLAVLQRAEALERVAYELVTDAASDGVRYIEVRFSPVLNIEQGLSMEGAVDATLRGLERGTRDFGTVARLIICALRHLDPAISQTLAELAVAYRGKGVVGFDLAGPERGHPAARHAAAFRLALANDLAVTVHAGEGDGGASVRQAVHACGALRLGHATRLNEDTSLLEFVNDRRITLEMCLTSNVQTRAVDDFDMHPARRYLQQGLNVVLNTDNRLMSGTTLSMEYWLAAKHLGMTWDDLEALALNGFASAFLPWTERQALVNAARAEMVALAACR